MIEISFVVLHVGHGQETTLLVYLYRVLVLLLAIGGIGVLVFRLLDAVEAVRSVSPFQRGRDEADD